MQDGCRGPEARCSPVSSGSSSLFSVAPPSWAPPGTPVTHSSLPLPAPLGPVPQWAMHPSQVGGLEGLAGKPRNPKEGCPLGFLLRGCDLPSCLTPTQERAVSTAQCDSGKAGTPTPFVWVPHGPCGRQRQRPADSAFCGAATPGLAPSPQSEMPWWGDLRPRLTPGGEGVRPASAMDALCDPREATEGSEPRLPQM